MNMGEQIHDLYDTKGSMQHLFYLPKKKIQNLTCSKNILDLLDVQILTKFFGAGGKFL